MIGAITAGLFSTGTTASTNSYESIATFTLASTSTGVTFSSIPSTYKHLQLRITANVSTTDAINFQFNGDTASNYALHRLEGNGATASASASSSRANIAVLTGAGFASTASTFGASIVDILDYANTNKNKTTRALSGSDRNGSGGIEHDSGLWASTAAISSIYVFPSSGNMAINTSIALYGIKG
jgi:hypothetical protein